MTFRVAGQRVFADAHHGQILRGGLHKNVVLDAHVLAAHPRRVIVVNPDIGGVEKQSAMFGLPAIDDGIVVHLRVFRPPQTNACVLGIND